MTATFMPKPLFEDNASGMHVHQSLWKGETNLFYGKADYAELSELGRYYIGGLLTPRLGAVRALRPDHELLSPSGAGLRSSDQSGLFPAQPLGLLPDPDVFAEPAGQTRRVPLAGSLLQSATSPSPRC